MESAEELARKIGIAIGIEYRESPNGRGGVMTVSKDYTDAAKLIEADRAAIRAECAKRAIAWCDSWNGYQILQPESGDTLRAAIMGEL